jgi:hypothetical protein
MRELLARRPALWAALGLFAVTVPFLMIGVQPDGDAIRFHLDGDAIRQGLMPYQHSFYLEYPPLSIPLFTFPSIVDRFHWTLIYRLENAVGWAIVIVLVSLLTSKRWPLFALALVPATLGAFTLMRLDAWPVACVLGAVIALTRGRTTLAYSLLAVGTMIKSWPIVLLPVFVLYRWTRRSVISFAVIVVGTLLPFVIFETVGSYNTFRGQLNRHLQLETIGSSVLLVLGRPVRTAFDSGSWSVFGGGADAIAKVQSAVQVVAILLVAWLFARSRRTAQDLLVAVMATVVMFAFLGKVLSPQYLLWVAPFALLFPVFVVPLAVACLLTREIFPTHYLGLIEMHDKPIALLAVRNVVLIVIVVLAMRAALRLRASPAHG